MAWIVQSLDEEWATVASSPAARRALMRWTARHPELGRVHSVDDFVDTRARPDWGDQALRVLAAEASTDQIAARTLLQALLGGLVCLASRTHHSDPDAIGELVAIAWNRIRTYPTHRPGRVAANVLLDTRKEYLRCRNAAGSGWEGEIERDTIDPGPGPEQMVCEQALMLQLVAAQQRGLVSTSALAVILRTRVGGESLVDVARDVGMSADAMWRRRSRAEERLRALPIAG